MADSEKEAVRTTIVGGRPPGRGREVGAIPRGVEVLLKKAAVDAEFRERFLAERAAAAATIELELDPAESAMLQAIPLAQLETIVAQTVVPVEQRRVFLGRLAAPMLAMLGMAVSGCAPQAEPAGIRPAPAGIQPAAPRTNQPPAGSLQATDGIRPDLPPTNRPPADSPSEALTRGIRPDVPRTNSPPAKARPTVPPSTNFQSNPLTQGIRPDRPGSW